MQKAPTHASGLVRSDGQGLGALCLDHSQPRRAEEGLGPGRRQGLGLEGSGGESFGKRSVTWDDREKSGTSRQL